MSEQNTTKGLYSEAQKRAIYNYRAKHREQYNKYQRERHQWRLANEDGYREKKELEARNRNAKYKKMKEQTMDGKVIVVPMAKPQHNE